MELRLYFTSREDKKPILVKVADRNEAERLVKQVATTGWWLWYGEGRGGLYYPPCTFNRAELV